MPSVVALLEQHELAARGRVDGPQEEADPIQAELAVAAEEWQEWAIAHKRVDTVLASDSGNTAATTATEDPRDAARVKSQVPVGREGPASVLSVDYQRIPQMLANHVRLGQAPLTCQKMAQVFGMDVVPARVGHCDRRRNAGSRAAG